SKWFKINKKSPSGTIEEIEVGTKKLVGKEVREVLKLKSANFTVSYLNNNFTFIVIGYGHGVGMSQYGADFYARQGMKYNEILAHYYVGTTLQKNNILKSK
ncbi:MAG: stage II sporulation protein D, partial [Oscillospiraceae bacterium]